jgi:hypothetical protein
MGWFVGFLVAHGPARKIAIVGHLMSFQSSFMLTYETESFLYA